MSYDLRSNEDVRYSVYTYDGWITVLRLGVIHMNGEYYLLCLPTENRFRSFLKFLERAPEAFECWKAHSAFSRFCSVITIESNKSNKFVLSRVPLEEGDSVQLDDMDEYSDAVGFVPMLLPVRLTSSGFEYDEDRLMDINNGTVECMGNLYKDNQVFRLGDSNMRGAYPGWRGNPGIKESVGIGDTEKTGFDYELPWIKYGNSWILSQFMVTGLSFNDFIDCLEVPFSLS